MTPLHPDQLKVLRIRFGIGALVLLACFVVGDIVLWERALAPFGIATAAGVVLAGLCVWRLPKRRYGAWGYRESEDELVVKHGLLVRQVTVVPFGRVQHIDIAQGPIERTFGLATLVLNTAGTRGASVHLPGLRQAQAEAMRDHIRGKIRQDML